MKKIQLTQGFVAVVDDSDYRHLVGFKWHAMVRQYKEKTWVYARRRSGDRYVYMHRVILGLKNGEFGDHLDGDTLNNRRANLRKCSHSENMRNRTRHRRSAIFKHKGTSRDGNRWRATIVVGGKRTRLGSFPSEHEAAIAYDAAAKRLHGNFARLNFP